VRAACASADKRADERLQAGDPIHAAPSIRLWMRVKRAMALESSQGELAVCRSAIKH